MKRPCLVYVNASWCGHCTAMRPTMEAVATMLKGRMPIYDIDADVYSGDLSGWNIDGYPTLLALGSTGVRQTFKGPRTAADILRFGCIHAPVPC